MVTVTERIYHFARGQAPDGEGHSAMPFHTSPAVKKFWAERSPAPT
jgi:hypothetical protein